MRMTALVAQWIVRLGGIVQIVFGILFWLRRALGFIPLHMLVGLLVTLAVALLSILAWRAKAPAGMVVAGLLLAILLPVIGMTQTQLLLGRWHWIIQVIHLLLGVGALRMGESLATFIRRPVSA
jgi:hypothetical protein